MTTRAPAEVSAALREEASYFEPAKVMASWDRWRAYISKGGKGSLPRDDFESLFDGVREALISGSDAIDRLFAELAKMRERAEKAEARLADVERQLSRVDKLSASCNGWAEVPHDAVAIADEAADRHLTRLGRHRARQPKEGE